MTDTKWIFGQRKFLAASKLKELGLIFPISLEFWCWIRKKAYTWTRVSCRGTSGVVVSMMHSLPGFVLVLKWSFVLLLVDTWWSTYGLTHAHGYHLQLNWSSSACYTSSFSCRESPTSTVEVNIPHTGIVFRCSTALICLHQGTSIVKFFVSFNFQHENLFVFVCA